MKFLAGYYRIFVALLVLIGGTCSGVYAGDALKKISQQELVQLLERVDTQNIKVVSVEELSRLAPDMAQLLTKAYPGQQDTQVLVLRSRAYTGGDIAAMLILPICSAVSLACSIMAFISHEWVAGAVLLVAAVGFGSGTYFVIVPDAR